MTPPATATELPIDVDALLAPIPGAHRGGVDIEYAEATEQIKAARRVVEQRATQLIDEVREKARVARLSQDPNADRMMSAARMVSLKVGLSEWNEVRRLAAAALQKHSKDLRIGVFLLESLVHTHGFAGAAAGLQVLRRLVEDYWPDLFPPLELDVPHPWAERIKTLEWIDQKLPAMITTLALTGSRTKFTLQHVRASKVTGDQLRARIADGWAAPKLIEKAIEELGNEGRDQLAAEIAQCRTEAKGLAAACEAKAEPNALSIGALVEVLDECEKIVARPAPEPKKDGDGNPEDPLPEDPTGGRGLPPHADGNVVLAKALEMVRAGKIDGLRLAQEHLMDGRTGRQRFVRQLELAELCLEAGVNVLAFPLFDDLGHLIEENAIIAEWEEKELFVRVWGGLKQSGAAIEAIRPEAGKRAVTARERLDVLQPPPPVVEPEPDESGMPSEEV